MNHYREFGIAWQGLKNGTHEYQYQIDDKVIEEMGYEHSDFHDLDCHVGLKLEKENGFFLLHFDIDGAAMVSCDRCGEEYQLDLWDEYELVVKLTDSVDKAEALNQEEDGDVVYFSRSESILNVFGWIYEFIMLTFPIQKIHPDKEDGTSGCNPEALKLLKNLEHNESEPTNEIWKGLEQVRKKIKNKSN